MSGGWNLVPRRIRSCRALPCPGYVAGTYTIDPGHSDVAFTVRHLMVSKVRGHFTYQGELALAPDNPLASSVTATIELSCIDTNNPSATTTSARPTSSRSTPIRR